MGVSAAAGRVGSIDALKAAAILTVVYIHACGRPFHMDTAPIEAFLTWWAVPAFFVASGFLHCRGRPLAPGELGRWLRRVLVPYAIATVLALAVRNELSPARVAVALLSGSAWPIYYFVPVLVGALVAAALLARYPGAAGPCAALFWVLGLAAAAGFDPVYLRWGILWQLRSPFTWWGYFLAGWTLARHHERVRRVPPPALRAMGVGALGAVAALVLLHRTTAPWRPEAGGALLYFTNYGIIAAILALAAEARPGRIVRFLSVHTYPIYLYHFFFTEGARRMITGPEAATVALVAGFVGPLVIIALGGRLLGPRARLLLG